MLYFGSEVPRQGMDHSTDPGSSFLSPGNCYRLLPETVLSQDGLPLLLCGANIKSRSEGKLFWKQIFPGCLL